MLNDTLRELQDISRQVRDKLDEIRNKTNSNQNAWVDAAADYANYFVQKAATKIFVQKYASSGVETKTGELLKAISRCVVWMSNPVRDGAKTKIYIGWPSGLPGTKEAKKSTEKSVYVYGSAVNYGAVRQPKHTSAYRDPVNGAVSYKRRPVVGGRLARSLKRKAYGAKGKLRVEQYIERNKRLSKKGVSQFAIKMISKQYTDNHTKKKRNTVTFDIKSAGISITRAFNFFQLNQQEQESLRDLWTASFNQKFAQLSTLKLAA